MNWEPQIFEEPQEPEKKQQYTRIILPKKNNLYYFTLIQKIVSVVLNIVMIILFVVLIFQYKSANDFDATSWAKEKEVSQNNKLTLKDFKGYENISDEMNKLSKNIKESSTNINNVPRGMLLYGPPGNGKTYLAKCLAGEIKQNAVFFAVNGSDFIEKFVGVGASRVRMLFQTARKRALEQNKRYFFIFIDEIDSIGKKRSSEANSNASETDSTLNALISEIDGFNTNNEKNPNPPYGIVLGSTNRAEILDGALIREGRLGKQILFDYPNKKNIKNILEYVLQKNKNRTEYSKQILEDEGLFKLFADALLTASDINSLIKIAIDSKPQNNSNITIDDLYEAFSEIKLGPKNKEEIDKDEENRIAIHELGHAMLFKALNFDVSYVNIEPRGQLGGYTVGCRKQNKTLYTRDELFRNILFLLGGRAAEFCFLKNVSSGSYDDYKKAQTIARKIIQEYGMWNDKEEIIIGNQEDKELQINTILNDAYQVAQAIIQQYKTTEVFSKTWDTLLKRLKTHKKLNKEDFNEEQTFYKR